MQHLTPSNAYDFYNLQLDLTNSTSNTLTFNFIGDLENHFDRFNLQASIGAISPPGDLLNPTGGSGLQYTDEGDIHPPNLGQIAFASGVLTNTTGSFDLSAFDGQIVNLRFQFGSDGSVTDPGVNIDNILVQGDVSAVPEPTAFGVIGLIVACLVRRKRRALA